jgi:hypothetical protein
MYACSPKPSSLPCLHQTVLGWPEQILRILDNSKNILLICIYYNTDYYLIKFPY